MTNIGHWLVLLGIALVVIAVVSAIVLLITAGKRGKKLEAQLELEYGPKDGKRRKKNR